MVTPKTEEEIELLRENGILVSKTLAEVGKAVAPGVTTAELNRVRFQAFWVLRVSLLQYAPLLMMWLYTVFRLTTF